MLKLIQITQFSDISYLKMIVNLLKNYRSFIFFNDLEDPILQFCNDLYAKNVVIIAAIVNNIVFGVLILKKFEQISSGKFFCYMYGGAERGFAREIEQALKYIFSDLKKKGCLAVRIETLCSNRAMRNLANRMNFKKVGKIETAGMRKNKILSSILYEKVL